MKKSLFGLALASAMIATTPAQAQAPELQQKIELNHFLQGISVEDIEAVTAFYVDVLDFEVVKDVPLGGGRHFRWLRNGTQGLELVQVDDAVPGPDRTPPAHFSTRGPAQLLMVVDDIEATKAILLARGVTLITDVTDVAVLGIRVMLLADPEGNPLEIVERLDK